MYPYIMPYRRRSGSFNRTRSRKKSFLPPTSGYPPAAMGRRLGANGGMSLILGGREPLAQPRLERIGRALDPQPQLFALGRGEVGQQEIGRIHPAGRPADADPDPVVVPRSQGGSYRPGPVMPIISATQFEQI